jgi:diacylglycerol kinase family enzyme
VDVRTDVRSVTMHRRTTMPYQVDGDHLGQVDELRFEHRPDAIRLVVPVGWRDTPDRTRVPEA